VSESTGKRTCFAHISDLHLTTLDGAEIRELLNKRFFAYVSWRQKRRFQHRQEVLAAIRQDLGECPLVQVVITGDLTHAGLPQEFVQAQQWLRELGEPAWIALVPGNHDACVRAPWQQTLGLWELYMASDEPRAAPFPSLRIRGDIAFIGLSSACPTPPFMATGSVGPEQLDHLPRMLTETYERGLFRVVYIHHSPLAGADKWRKRLIDAESLQGQLRAHGAEIVLHGHGHRSLDNALETCHGKALVLAVPSASAIGLHGCEVARYNVIGVSRAATGWEVDIESHRYEAAQRRFIVQDRRSLDLIRA
jgi:3',5'-cyclic AMP phosphodiesterase CpdA